MLRSGSAISMHCNKPIFGVWSMQSPGGGGLPQEPFQTPPASRPPIPAKAADGQQTCIMPP